MYYLLQINAVIDYFENGIESEISCKDIERISGCSYDNFGRIFSYVTGQTIADYIRGRRLTLAASDLVNGNEKILDIALKYGYNSPDSFTKAFYRFHGLVPSEVRKRPSKIKAQPRIHLPLPNHQDIKEMHSVKYYNSGKGDIMMNALYLRQHLNPTIEEKREAMITVNLVLNLAKKTREAGLLALEKELESEQGACQFLKIGISYLADGLEPSDLRRFLENYLASSHMTGKELLCGIVILEGLCAIQEGLNLHFAAELMCSYFGVDFRGEFYKRCCIAGAKASWQDVYHHKKPYSEKTRLLDKYKDMPKTSLQRLLREIGPDTLSTALHGSGFDVLSLFFDNLSDRNARVLCDIMQEAHPDEPAIIEAQKNIDLAAEQLLKQNEIIR